MVGMMVKRGVKIILQSYLMKNLNGVRMAYTVDKVSGQAKLITDNEVKYVITRRSQERQGPRYIWWQKC